MKKLNSKGFTLVEILAIIVILGVVALVAFPITKDIIKSSRRKSFASSLDGVVRSFELHITENVRTRNAEIDYDDQALKSEHSNFISGTIDYVDGKINLVDFSDGEFCGNGTKGNFTVSDGACSSIFSPEACFTFDETFNTITDYKYDGITCTSRVNIPSKIGGVTVEKIGDRAFMEKQLTSVILPNTITDIGMFSFALNNLTSITIPDSVINLNFGSFGANQLESLVIPKSITYIADAAFQSNKLTSVIIPNTVVGIGSYVFADNLLESIFIPSSVTSIGDAAFGMNMLSNVTFSEGLTTISEYAFAYNQLENIEFPSTLKVIERYAFNDNSLINLTIPSGVTTIGNWAFADNRLESITLPNTITTLDFSAFNNNQLPPSQAFIYKRNSNGTIDNTVLISYGGAKREGVEIPNNVKSINSLSFAFVQLKSVSIPPSVTKIIGGAFSNNQIEGEEAFIYARNSDGSIDYTTIASYGGANRDNVVIPSQVKTIGDYAFYVNYITSVTIPNTVTKIYASAFSQNRLPEDQAFIYARKSDGSIDYTTLVSYGGDKRSNVSIPDTVTTITEKALWSAGVGSINIPSSVTSIGKNAFKHNDGITFNIDRATNKISGSPWGAERATINWKGTS